MATVLNQPSVDSSTIAIGTGAAIGEINTYDFRTDSPAVFKARRGIVASPSHPASLSRRQGPTHARFNPNSEVNLRERPAKLDGARSCNPQQMAESETRRIASLSPFSSVAAVPPSDSCLFVQCVSPYAASNAICFE